MSAPRLAFVVAVYADYGGMQRNLARIAAHCRRQGAVVTLITGAVRGGTPDGMPVIVLPVRALTNHGRNAAFAAAMTRHLAAHRYDCVVGFTKLPGLDVYYAADPCLAARTRQGYRRLLQWTPRMRGLLTQEHAVFAPGQATRILLPAPGQRDAYVAHYGTETHRFTLLPPGLDTARLAPTASAVQLRRRLLRPHEHYLLLTVATAFHTKGVDRSIRALAALPAVLRAQTRLIVLGPGRVGRYRRLAGRLGVAQAVDFVGREEDVAAYYHAADLLSHPARVENTGTPLLEAMYCGLPVLASAECGYAPHVMAAQAGGITAVPFHQATFNRLCAQSLAADRRLTWGGNGRRYCNENELQGLVACAADAILAQASECRHAA